MSSAPSILARVKVLAIDYGRARTGVAVSDPTGTVARPVAVIERVDSESGLARLAQLVCGLAVLAFGVPSALTRTDNPPPPPPPAPVAAPRPKVLHIVFPEGFTRRDMAERITAVNRIALQKRHVSPKLSASRYLAL